MLTFTEVTRQENILFEIYFKNIYIKTGQLQLCFEVLGKFSSMFWKLLETMQNHERKFNNSASYDHYRIMSIPNKHC